MEGTEAGCIELDEHLWIWYITFYFSVDRSLSFGSCRTLLMCLVLILLKGNNGECKIGC